MTGLFSVLLPHGDEVVVFFHIEAGAGLILEVGFRIGFLPVGGLRADVGSLPVEEGITFPFRRLMDRYFSSEFIGFW